MSICIWRGYRNTYTIAFDIDFGIVIGHLHYRMFLCLHLTQARTARAGIQGIALPNENFAISRKFILLRNFALKNKKRRDNRSILEIPKKRARIAKNPNKPKFLEI